MLTLVVDLSILAMLGEQPARRIDPRDLQSVRFTSKKLLSEELFLSEQGLLANPHSPHSSLFARFERWEPHVVCEPFQRIRLVGVPAPAAVWSS